MCPNNSNDAASSNPSIVIGLSVNAWSPRSIEGVYVQCWTIEREHDVVASVLSEGHTGHRCGRILHRPRRQHAVENIDDAGSSGRTFERHETRLSGSILRGSLPTMAEVDVCRFSDGICGGRYPPLSRNRQGRAGRCLATSFVCAAPLSRLQMTLFRSWGLIAPVLR